MPHPSHILAKGGTYKFNRPISTCYEKFMRPGRPKPSTLPNRPRETAPKFPSSRKGTPQVCRTNRGRKALPLCGVPHPNTLKSVEPFKMLGCPILRIFWRRVGRINSTGLFLGLQLCRIDQRNRTEISLQYKGHTQVCRTNRGRKALPLCRRRVPNEWGNTGAKPEGAK